MGMSEPPSFSSFPDLGAGPSKQPPPSFGSFPNLETGRKRSRSPSRTRDDGERRERRDRDRAERKERDRRKAEKEERRGVEDERRRRHRSRSTEKRRDERDDRDDRRRKEERRRREREKAEALIRGDIKPGSSTPKGRESRGEEELGKKRAIREVDEGVPWYESGGTGKKQRGGYEEPFDPTSNKGFLDSVGDRDALRYGTSASHSAPKYHRDDGRVLGLNEGLRIVVSRDRTEKGIEIAPRGKPYVPRYHSRHLDGSLSKALLRLLVRPGGQEGDEFRLNSSYVSLDSQPSRRKEFEDIPTYRSISKVDDRDDDEDFTLMEATLSGFSTLEQDVRTRTAEMERHLRSHPEDVEAWISYSILHSKLSPDIANAPANAAVDISKLPQNRASAEVTLSILARALDAHPSNFLSTDLHIAYIRAAEIFWTPEKVTGRWRNVLRELGERLGNSERGALEEQMIQLWLGYIEWREGQGFGKSEGQGSAGGVDEVIDVYIECLEKLGSGQIATSDLHAREENQLYLFLRACLFMKQTGYTERALASFQALMEITFFKPEHLRPPAQAGPQWFSGILDDFEAFWDSEAPRIGENEAKGWGGTMSDEPATRSPFSDQDHQSSDPFERWLEAERHADRRNALPGRATDLDEDEDDPYRVILYSDIQPFLFFIRSPEVRLQLVYAFLTFLGLPFSPPDSSTAAASASDPRLRTSIAYNDSVRAMFWPPKAGKRAIPWQTVGGEPMEPEEPKALDSPFSCPVKCWVSERNTLFAHTSHWYRDLENMELESLDIQTVRNTFQLLRPLIPDPTFTLAYFAFEAAVSPKTALKATKAILAENRDDLVLWDGYARLERQRRNVAVARTVYATALQAAHSDTERKHDSEDEKDLWASWAEMEFEHGDEGRCLGALIMAAGLDRERMAEIAKPDSSMSKPSSITMLKCRQHYSSYMVPLSPGQLILSALFAYLTSGVDSARNLLFQQLSRLPQQSSSAEEAYQLLVKLLHFHTSRHASPASLSRDAIELAIQSFPHNTMFLSLYLWGEAGGRVYGRIQKLISHITTTEDAGVVGQLWAVWAEAMSARRTFWDEGGGGAERVRTVLDKAINSRIGKQSIPLWRLYIEFESLMGRSNSAKQLCYRAVSAIGGCKELYLLPFTPTLRPHFTPRELCDWSELVTERGIRIRVPFEQFFDPNGADEEGMLLPDDEEPEEDELEFLRERQALKPY